MGDFAKKLHRRMASKAHTLPTKEPKRRPGELLPGGIKDVATLIKEGLGAAIGDVPGERRGEWAGGAQVQVPWIRVKGNR
jgi:hypothetical protein